MKPFYYFALLCLLTTPTFAQIGMGGQPHPSAALDLKATDKVFYPPRLTTVQRIAIVNAQPGAFVYDTDKGTFFMFDGQNWYPMLFSTSGAPLSRVATDGVADDNFGVSVAISGEYAIVGAFNKTVDGKLGQGVAYIFNRSGTGWYQQAQLTANDGAANDGFGFGVAISGDYAMVGAPYDDVNTSIDQGSLYVFLRSGTSWTQQAKLTAIDGSGGDNFGLSVVLSGDYALVSAPYDDVSINIDQGSAYVFNKSGVTWTQQAKLTATDGAAYDQFGSSGYGVSIMPGYALVGADADDINGVENQGSAYVFVQSGNTWTQQAKLIADDGGYYDGFGLGVAIFDNYAVIGSPFHDVGSSVDQGVVYVFVRTGTVWTQQTKLYASDGASNDHFGARVAAAGNYAVVGAPGNDVGNNPDQGSAYLFERAGNTWTQLQVITDNSAISNTLNGRCVSISNNVFVVGGNGFQNYKGKVSFGTISN